jgi:S1-C subfamily serine protease
MAARAADYLQSHGRIHMIVLSGSGHLIYGDGIPSRLARRTKLSSAIVLNDIDGTLAPDMGDILLVQAPQSLPPAGNLGLSVSDANGSIRVDGLDDDSAAGAAGVLVGDGLLALDGQRLLNVADLSIALLDKAPGDKVRLRVLRHSWAYAPQRELEIPITLR